MKTIKTILVAMMVMATIALPVLGNEYHAPTVTSYAVGSATASGNNVDIHTIAVTTGDLAHKESMVASYSDGSTKSGSLYGDAATGYSSDPNMWSQADIGTLSPSDNVVIDAGAMSAVDKLLNTGIEVGGTISDGSASAVVGSDLTLTTTGHGEHKTNKFNSNSAGIATIGSDISSVSVEINVTVPVHHGD